MYVPLRLKGPPRQREEGLIQSIAPAAYHNDKGHAILARSQPAFWHFRQLQRLLQNLPLRPLNAPGCLQLLAAGFPCQAVPYTSGPHAPSLGLTVLLLLSHRKIFYGRAFRQPNAILRQEEEMPLCDHRGRVNEVDHGLSMPCTNSSTSAQPCSSKEIPISSGLYRRISARNLLSAT